MDEIKKALQENHLALHTLIVFHRAERTLQSMEGKVIKEYGLTPMQFGVLDVLYTKGPLHVGEIIEKMLATSGNMTVVIRNMERDGYVCRMEDAADKRSFLISLTEKGRKKIEEVLPAHAAYIGRIFEFLPEEDQKELIRILRKFRERQE